MRFAIPIIVFLLLVVVFSFGLFNDPRKLPSPFLGEPAPGGGGGAGAGGELGPGGAAIVHLDG